MVLIPSVSIEMVLRNISKKEFFCAFFLSLLDKIKVGGESCLPRHFANTNAKRKPAIPKKGNKSRFLPPYHRTGDSAGDMISGVYLRISSSYCFILFDLIALSLWVLYQSYYRS